MWIWSRQNFMKVSIKLWEQKQHTADHCYHHKRRSHRNIILGSIQAGSNLILLPQCLDHNSKDTGHDSKFSEALKKRQRVTGHCYYHKTWKPGSPKKTSLQLLKDRGLTVCLRSCHQWMNKKCGQGRMAWTELEQSKWTVTNMMTSSQRPSIHIFLSYIEEINYLMTPVVISSYLGPPTIGPPFPPPSPQTSTWRGYDQSPSSAPHTKAPWDTSSLTRWTQCRHFNHPPRLPSITRLNGHNYLFRVSRHFHYYWGTTPQRVPIGGGLRAVICPSLILCGHS